MKRLQLVRIVFPAAIVLAGAAVVLADHSSTPIAANPTATTPDPTPVPSSTPQVTVNGRTVLLDAQGNAKVSLPSGGAQVNKSGGQATVTTNNASSTTTSTVSGNGNLNVTVNTTSNGGSSSSSTQVSSSSSTVDDNSGSADVDIFSNDFDQ